MRFEKTALTGAWIAETDRLADERGWFARAYDAAEFADRGIAAVGMQCNLSYNGRCDTLRGLHYQRPPHGEPKLVRCIYGAIWDVAVDLRPDSSTYLSWHGVELSSENARAFFIPEGCAHGFQTLSDEAVVLYMMGSEYVSEAADGVRWDDSAFAIQWPAPRGERTISDRDCAFPDYVP